MTYEISGSMIVSFLLGFVIGSVVTSLLHKTKNESVERLLFGLIICGIWVYNNFVIQVDNWLLNMLLGVVVAHFFDLKQIKDYIEDKLPTRK